MNIQQLKVFVCVSETRNFSKAAKKMHLTQQALSKCIAKLEDELGAQLLYRNERMTTLTNVGQKLLPVAESLIQKHEEHEALMRKLIAQNTHSIDIAFENIALLNGFPAGLLSRIGDMRIASYIAKDNASCVKAVREGSADCAFCILPRDLDSLEYYEVINQYAHVIMSINHPLSKKEYVQIEDLKHENHQWLSINCLSFQDYFRACMDAGFYPKITKEYPSVELLYEELPNGLDITVGTDVIVKKYPDQLASRPIMDESCKLRIGFIYAKDHKAVSVLQSYFKVVSDTYASL